MSDTIESLLQENLHQVQAMHTASEQMLRNANTVFEYGQKYQARFDNSYHQALEKLRAIQERMNQLTENLSTDETVDQIWYDVVTSNADKLAQTMLAAEQKSLQALQKVSAHIQAQEARVDSYLVGAGEAFDLINNSTQEFESEFKSSTQNLTQTYETTTNEVKDMCGRFHDQHRDIQTSLDELRSNTDQQRESVSESTNQSMDEFEAAVKELIQGSDTQSNGVLEIVGESFSDEVSQANADSAGSLDESVQSIFSTFEGSTSGALGAVEDLTSNLDEIVNLAKKIEPVLKLVKALV